MQWKRSDPVYPVAEIGRAVEWYRRTFGFESRFESEIYAVLYRNNIALHLVKQGAGPPAIGGPAQAQFWIDGKLDELFATLLAQDAKVIQAPADQPWGHRDFMVEDLDGNIVCVTIPLEAGT